MAGHCRGDEGGIVSCLKVPLNHDQVVLTEEGLKQIVRICIIYTRGFEMQNYSSFIRDFQSLFK